MAKLFLVLGLIFQLADKADAINISGLSFSCKSCKQLSNETCEFRSKDELLAVSCKELFSLLIDRELKKEETSLSEISLLKALLSKDIKSTDSEKLLKLLLTIRNIDPRFVEKYEQVLVKNFQYLKNQIIQKNLSESQTSNLVKIVSVSQKTDLRSFLPVIVNYSAKWDEAYLFSSLSASSLTYDLQTLNLYKESIKSHALEGLKKISSFVEKLNHCELQTSIKRLDCLESIGSFGFSNYSKKLFLNEALRTLKGKELDAGNILKILSKTAYKEYANQNFYSFIITQLSRLDYEQELGTETMEMLKFLAIYHPRIAARLRELSKKQSAKVDTIVYLPILLLVASLSFLLWRQIRHRQVRTSSSTSEQQLLMQYFDLPVWASKKDLKKKYREKIKTLHPDTNKTLINEEDFRRACQNYKRACALMEGS